MDFWDDAEIISTYTRAQAIEDGTLVDLTEWAKETGIKFPVAVTREVWDQYIELPKFPPGNEAIECQDVRGRAHDVLWMFLCAARRHSGAELLYKLYVRNDNRKPKLVTLKAVCGPGDDPRPVITIMLPEQD